MSGRDSVAPQLPAVERLRKEAKRWLKALRAGDPAARERLERALPQPSAEPGLREVQHALARELGAESWRALKEREELAALATAGGDALLDELLQCACIFSGGPLDLPPKWRRAERIRALHPELARASLHAAVVCGDLAQVERWLREDPNAVTRKAGPQRWEPLLLLCYGRLSSEHTVEI